jgi:phosphatidylserine decarboxylase
MRLSAGIREGILSRFAAAVGADCSEAEKPLREYVSLLDFFTRRLKPGLRPQARGVPGGINSPVDGDLIASGRIEEGTLIQAKGLPYRLDELLGGDPLAARFSGGHFATLYLSPKDYHRIHVPCEGLCRAAARIEGELWPVNAASTAHTPRLYVRNRRSTWIAEGKGCDEGLWIGAVLVAATHVGGAVIDPRWLSGRTLPPRGRLEVDGLPARPGDDLGLFELGSTVVLLVGGEQAGRWSLTRAHGPVRVGERLGESL